MGSDFQFIDIVLFAMIAAFLILRLRSVLGRHKDSGEGHQSKQKKMFSSETPDNQANENEFADNVVSLPDPNQTQTRASVPKEGTSINMPSDAGVNQIQTELPGFDPTEFLVGAKTAFEMIVQAYAEGNIKLLETLLNDEVYNNFFDAIETRKTENVVLENTLVRIASGEIIEAFMSDSIANITVKIISEQINVTRNSAGAIVEGQADQISLVTDIWTFARNTNSKDPNWQLVATRSLD
jgi:predicted lipid-binding transport protein (Tim44 family)